MGISLGRIARGIVTGGMSEIIYEPNKEGIADFFGKSDRREAEEYAEAADQAYASATDFQSRAYDVADARRSAEAGQINALQSRWDNTYAPIEQGIADELLAGPRTEEQAAIAGGTFANQFDASTAARERSQLQAGVNYRAGSSSQRLQAGNDAYSRASGIASAQNTARREEDDKHYLRSSQFFQNGSGIQNQLMSGLSQMYGADYTANTNAANFSQGQTQYNQDLSNTYTAQSTAGLNTVLQLGGTAAAAYATGGTSLATEGAGVSTAPKSSAATPVANNYMNASTGQTIASNAGDVQSYINRYD